MAHSCLHMMDVLLGYSKGQVHTVSSRPRSEACSHDMTALGCRGFEITPSMLYSIGSHRK